MAMQPTSAIALSILLSVAHTCQAVESAVPEPLVLDNGMVAVLLPVRDAGQVGVEAFYEVGFMHEPDGMTQAAHLVEHLVCFGATRHYDRQESFKLLNRMGMANAETLADWTHYDYVVPPDRLDLALQIEADRLTQLRFDEALVRSEAKRCYLETDAVERNPASGMMKHAMMALSQAWRHGRTTALVRGGLEEMSVEALAKFHRSHYQPDRLTLILVGEFEEEEAGRLIENHFGSIPAPSRQDVPPTNWNGVAQRREIRWDAQVRAVCLAFPPPQDLTEAALLSLFGSHLMQHLYQHERLQQIAHVTLCSSHQWKVGVLPFFVYAAAKENQPLSSVERELKSVFYEVVSQSTNALPSIQMMLPQLQRQIASVDLATIEHQARMVARMQNSDEKLATGMVLGQTAINAGVLHRLLAPQPRETTENMGKYTPARFRRFLTQYLNEDRMLVTHIVPLE